MKNQKHALRWVGLVVAIFAIHMTVATVLVMRAVNDPAFAVESDYYNKAVRWDEFARSAAKSDALGWQLTLHVGAAEGAESKRVVRAVVVDAYGDSIVEADVYATVFYNARAADQTSVVFRHEGGGVYEASMRFSLPGLWEFRFSVEQDENVYQEQVRLDIAPERKLQP